ncbi:MAG: DUF1592 domain-containing protein [Pirellulaceae bacterium]
MSIAILASAAPPVIDEAAFGETVKPFLTEHCNSCHDGELAEGDLRLDNLAANFSDREPSGHWVEVLDRINLGEMPPEDEPRPDPADLAKVTEWISNNLLQMRRSAESTGGHVVMRRLSRVEYANTVRDLLGVVFVDGEGPMEDLPPDGRIQGFDRMSKALLVDPSLMQAYIDVGSEVADRAVVFRPATIPTKTMRFDFVDTRDSAMSYLLNRRAFEINEPFLTVMEDNARTFAKLRHPSIDKEIPVTGQYRVRVCAAADPGDSLQPVFMDVTYGSLGRLARFRVDATLGDPNVYEFEQTFDAAVPGEFGVSIVNGTRFTEGRQVVHKAHRDANELFDNGKPMESLRAKARMRAEGNFDSYIRSGYRHDVIDTKPLPKLHLKWIEVVGPLQSDFPPPSMNAIFPDGPPAADQQTIETATAAIKRLLPRAFRRRTAQSELDSIVAIMKADMAAGASFERAMETGLTAMLCSPNFLYLRENESTKTRELTPFELATRLSYFLWSSKPDDELFRSAVSGKLTKDPAELDRQIDRMLADNRSEGFVNGFARQWLKVDEFTRFLPDEKIFPKFYETEFAGLEKDVREEPLAFFREVLHKDEPIRAFLSSGWLMLNEKLAAYYGITGVSGSEFRRVPLIKPNGWMASAKERLLNTPQVGPIHVIGPFSGQDLPTVFQQSFAPEEVVDLDQPVGELRWIAKPEWADDTIHEVFSGDNSVFYLYRQIDSKIAQDLTLALGSDDAIKVWINGVEVLQNYVVRSVEKKQERVTVALNAGKNDLLIKIVNGSGTGGFYFLAETIQSEALAALKTPGKKRTPEQRRLLEDTYLAESASAPRGGLLGMAGIHLWGADGNRTKPVERGKYLLTVLFNDPPPPPPPNAGEVEPNLRGKQLTVRERLELHREQTTCNNCHRRIDPYGLALENFNAIGQWREQADGEKPVNQYWGEREAINPSGVLPSGVEFQNFLEFKRAILAQEERFTRGLTEKLMMYALGRTIEPTDRPIINRMLAAAHKDGITLRELVKQIAKSQPFLTK